MAPRQLTLPCNFTGSMSYLQVPGQERPGGAGRVSPSPEGGQRRARLPTGGMDFDEMSEDILSPVTLRRRMTLGQSSIDSYCSFASEGDGDIFASTENMQNRPRLQRQTSFCIPDSHISEYSEFHEDFHSSISELFGRRYYGRLGTQGTFSEQGSIRSLSIDQEEITFEIPGTRSEEREAERVPLQEQAEETLLEESSDTNIAPAETTTQVGQDNNDMFADGDNNEFFQDLPFEDGDGYASSSCSISMSSDIESSHQITVPVFIEPAPPEIRLNLPAEMDTELGDAVGPSGRSSPRERQGGAGGHHLIHQETMHTDSGLDTEEICPASPTASRFSADAVLNPPDSPPRKPLLDDDSLRLVLVRDIGIQCSSESPNLNLHRRHNKAVVTVEREKVARGDSLSEGDRRDSLSGKFQEEILF